MYRHPQLVVLAAEPITLRSVAILLTIAEHTMNKFKIGEVLTQEEFDDVWEYRANYYVNTLPRNIEDYWSVYKYSLNKSKAENDLLCDRIVAAFKGNADDGLFWISESAFVTDNTEIAMELYKHIKLDFVYDFHTGLWFMDLFGGHESTMGQLYELASGRDFGNWQEAAELYVQKGHGMFKSSQGRSIFLGPDVPVPEIFRPYRDKIKEL